jgi:ribosomal protein L24
MPFPVRRLAPRGRERKKLGIFPFSQGQRVKVTGGVHRGAEGVVVRAAKKTAVIRTRKRVKARSPRQPKFGPEGVPAVQTNFVRIPVDHLQAHQVQKPKRTRRSKRTDTVSRKMSRIGELEREWRLFRNRRIFRGKQIRSGRTSNKIRRALRERIEKLREELKGV